MISKNVVVSRYSFGMSKTECEDISADLIVPDEYQEDDTMLVYDISGIDYIFCNADG